MDGAYFARMYACVPSGFLYWLHFFVILRCVSLLELLLHVRYTTDPRYRAGRPATMKQKTLQMCVCVQAPADM